MKKAINIERKISFQPLLEIKKIEFKYPKSYKLVKIKRS